MEKQVFLYQIFEDGEVWLEMLSKRNLLTRTYDESLANEAYLLIKERYAGEVERLVNWLQEQRGDVAD